MNRVTISILTYSALPLARRCIAAVFEHTTDFDLILTANGNQDVAAFFGKLAMEHKNVVFVVNAKNEGFIEPNKHALRLTQTPVLVLLNDDVIVTEGWMEKLLAPFDSDSKCALVGPEGSCSELLPNFHGTYGKKEYLEGSMLAIRTSIAKKHGLFEGELVGAYGEDSHQSLSMRELGYTLHWVPITIHHARGATSATVPQVREWQEKNHAWLRKRWGHYLKVRKMDYPILVRRQGAWGDVLLTTAVIREIKRMRPLSPIWVETDCAEVFRGNPHVAKADRRIPMTSDTLCIELNMSYEMTVDTHIVEAYRRWASNALGQEIVLESLTPELFYERPKWYRAGRSVTLHIGPVCWSSKEWGIEKFNKLALQLGTRFEVILVGATKTAPSFCHTDKRGETTLEDLANWIRYSQLFIGLDSFPLHVAQAVGTPAIGLFGVTSSKFILTAPNAHGIDSTAPSAGLRHRQTNQVVVDDGGAAMRTITVEQVLAKVDELFPT
jgi:ADP-heptose:LPS heptosyltransferase